VSLGDGVHDANVTLEGLGAEELREHLPQLLGFNLRAGFKRRWEYLVHTVWPPRHDQFVFVREQELVACSSTEHNCFLSKERGLEHFGRVLGHAFVYELLWMPFPPQ